MVTSPSTRGHSKGPGRAETLAEKFERLRSEPFGAPIPKLTRREALYFLNRLAGSEPKGARGIDVVRGVRSDWGARMDLNARKR